MAPTGARHKAEGRVTKNGDASSTLFYHRPGDKKQLMFQDVTAKLVRSDILRKVCTKKLIILYYGCDFVGEYTNKQIHK